jgi:hypothetical protein
MKYLVCIILVLLILSLYLSRIEGFTTYQINFSTDILPYSLQGDIINRGYKRCICSASGDCRCVNDSQTGDGLNYSEMYFD